KPREIRQSLARASDAQRCAMSVAFSKNEDCAPATDGTITTFERERGIFFPSDYRKFLFSSPGGSPTPDWSSFGRDGDFVAYVYGIHEGIEWKRLSYAIKQFGHDLTAFLPVAV